MGRFLSDLPTAQIVFFASSAFSIARTRPFSKSLLTLLSCIMKACTTTNLLQKIIANLYIYKKQGFFLFLFIFVN